MTINRNDNLSSALQMFNENKFIETIEICKNFLKHSSNHHQALFLMGLSYYKLNYLDLAKKFMKRSIKSNSRNPSAYLNLGLVYHSLKEFEEAINCYDNAIVLNQNYAAAYYNRGNSLSELKKYDEAYRNFTQAILCNPNFIQAIYNRALVLLEMTRLHEALADFKRVLELDPQSVEALNNHGLTLQKLDCHKEAIESFNQAIKKNELFFITHYNRGNSYFKLKNYPMALIDFEKSIDLNSNFFPAYINKGNALRYLEQPEEAYHCFKSALNLNGQNAILFNNLGNMAHELHYYDEAKIYFDKAIELDPKFADAYTNRAYLELSLGDFRAGWKDYEWRKLKEDAVGKFLSEKPTLEIFQDAIGKTVLVYAEQGFGDTIQFCRYLTILAHRNISVLFLPQKRLMELTGSISHKIRIVSHDEVFPDYDYQISLLSLPKLFDTHLETIPSHVPYLKIDEGRLQKWREYIEPRDFKIGISWQGSRAGDVDLGRSFPLKLFHALSKVEGVRLISLQKGDGVEQMLDLPDDMKIEHLGDYFDSASQSFLDAAAVISNLDLVISSDTAIAHLSGSLGCPTWVALKYRPDWRWQLNEIKTPWYPTMRLFRQKTRGDWISVFDEINSALLSELKKLN
jgi:tetratricopeptide (TPR) repeat protein